MSERLLKRRAYADGRRGLLQKALENAEELCGMVDRIDAEAGRSACRKLDMIHNYIYIYILCQ